MLVVVITANHFWLDGIVAAVLVALVVAARRLRRGGPPAGPAVSQQPEEISV
jgi:hypothetical protein